MLEKLEKECFSEVCKQKNCKLYGSTIFLIFAVSDFSTQLSVHKSLIKPD